jgi:hypothetical protein
MQCCVNTWARYPLPEPGTPETQVDFCQTACRLIKLCTEFVLYNPVSSICSVWFCILYFFCIIPDTAWVFSSTVRFKSARLYAPTNSRTSHRIAMWLYTGECYQTLSTCSTLCEDQCAPSAQFVKHLWPKKLLKQMYRKMNNAGNVRINVTMRRVRVTIIAVEIEWVLTIVSVCL